MQKFLISGKILYPPELYGGLQITHTRKKVTETTILNEYTNE
jgi:hypothetical protein